MNTKIVEMIPDNMPEWMKEAMDDGQLFNRVIKRVALLESALQEIIELPSVRQDECCCIAMTAMDAEL